MAQQVMHAALTSKQFPIDFRELSNTIVMSDGLDQQRQTPNGWSGRESEQSFGVCQAYHLQNILPIARGYSSAHYRRVINAVSDLPEGVRLDDVFVLVNETNDVALYSPAGGENYVFDAQVGNWVSFPSGFSGIGVVAVNLKNESYILYPGIGIYQYNFVTSTLDQVETTGITWADTLGLAAVDGRLVTWTAKEIYWGSVQDPLDFTPSQSTGAGSTSVLALRGAIVTIRPLGSGAVVYTTQNAVAMQASGNFAFPFVFSEIPGAAGIANQRHVAGDSGQGTHLVWTFSGFLEVSSRGAQPIWPELTEGLTRGFLPSVDAGGRPRMLVYERLNVRLSMIGSEYVVVSVGEYVEDATPIYADAYVFNMRLGRWGQIKVPHAAAFVFSVPQFAPALTYDDFAALYETYDDIPGDLYYQDLGGLLENQITIPGQNFGILTPTGAVHLCIPATDLYPNVTIASDPLGYEQAGAAIPRLTLGRFKIRRSRGVRLEWFNSERMLNAEVQAFSHGYTGSYLRTNSKFTEHKTATGRYYGRLSGDSISIQFTGAFVLSDLAICLGDAGKRHLQSSYQVTNMIIGPKNMVVGTSNMVL